MSGNFEVCPVGTVARLAAVEAERDALRLCFEVTELERSKYKAERDALLEALAWIDRRCPASFLLQDLHKVHLEAAFDAGVCARAAIAKAKGGGNG